MIAAVLAVLLFVTTVVDAVLVICYAEGHQQSLQLVGHTSAHHDVDHYALDNHSHQGSSRCDGHQPGEHDQHPHECVDHAFFDDVTVVRQGQVPRDGDEDRSSDWLAAALDEASTLFDAACQWHSVARPPTNDRPGPADHFLTLRLLI